MKIIRDAERYDKTLLAQQLNEGFNHMDASARLVLTLIYYEGMTLQEASAVLERSVSEVQALLVSARTVMRLYTDIFDRIDGTYAVISESMYQPVDYKA